jgi:hypothetical protein
MEKGFAAARTDRYLPDLYAEMASCTLDSSVDALWAFVRVSIVVGTGARSDRGHMMVIIMILIRATHADRMSRP